MSKKKPDHQTQSDLAFPKEWTLFGPVGQADPEPDFAGLTAIPKELTIAGKKLAAQAAAFTDNRLDIGARLGGKAEGKTAYLLANVEVARDTEVELGAGADWWMKWWVNGEVVCDTLQDGNGSWGTALPPGSPVCRAAEGRARSHLRQGRQWQRQLRAGGRQGG